MELHPDAQKGALQALYQEVGCARSLPAYELPDGRLELIDGHLRRQIDPEMEVEVKVLDINEQEARELRLSIDPLVERGQMQEQLYERLRENTPTAEPELEAMGQEPAQGRLEALERARKPIGQDVAAQHMLLVMCQDEKQQLALLARFQGEGLDCKCLLA